MLETTHLLNPVQVITWPDAMEKQPQGCFSLFFILPKEQLMISCQKGLRPLRVCGSTV